MEREGKHDNPITRRSGYILGLGLMVASISTVAILSDPRDSAARDQVPVHDSMAPELSNEQGAYLGELRGRTQRLRIRLTPDGPRYTVLDAQGFILDTNLDRESLHRLYPDLDPASIDAGSERTGRTPELKESRQLMIADDPGGW
ncbi:MAG: hypothetical protein EA423_06245 [Phycisphaerales bacterium]|nr:MAG: hypothetical protein EA423_06245 [Phycisphaerales bacterium]